MDNKLLLSQQSCSAEYSARPGGHATIPSQFPLARVWRPWERIPEEFDDQVRLKGAAFSRRPSLCSFQTANT